MKTIKESKIIPIIKQNGTFDVPTFLKSKLFIDFSKSDGFEFSFDELIRKIHNSPIFKKPEIGTNPFNSKKQVSESPKKVEPLQHKDQPLVELMKKLITDYENGNNWTTKETITNHLNLSRIMLDLIISEAKAKKYIRTDTDGDLVLLDGGKMYALQNNLIK